MALRAGRFLEDMKKDAFIQCREELKGRCCERTEFKISQITKKYILYVF